MFSIPLSFRMLLLLLAWTPQTVPPATTALSVENQHLAAIIGIIPVVQTETTARQDAAYRTESETERVLAASLDTDIAIAKINDEIAELKEERSRIRSRSDGRMKRLELAGIVFTAGSLAGESLELNTHKEHVATLVEISADAAAFIVAALSFRETDRGKAAQNLHFNMLASVLDRPAYANSRYPEVVWNYLDSQVSLETGKTPRQQLIEAWTQKNLLGRKKAAEETVIDRMTGTYKNAAEMTPLKPDDIDNRIEMLDDLAAKVAHFKSGLRDLMQVFKAEQHGGR